MGLFEKIFGKINNNIKASQYFKTLTAYQPTFYNWNGKLYESELVRSSIDARARHISKLKVEIIGSAKPVMQTKLKKKPNSFQTWSQFLYRLSTILDMQNSAFIVPIFDIYGEIEGIFPVLPSQCTVIDVNGTAWIKYMFNNGQTAAIEMNRCGIMTKFQYDNDFFGSPNTALNETMSLISINNQGIKEAVKSSAVYRFMAKLNNFSKAEDLAKERKRFSNENFSAEAEGGGLLLFPNTYSDIQQIKNSPYTVDKDQKELINKNVYDYFGVNEDILQNKAYGDKWDAFYEGAIEPFAVQFSEVLSFMLFTDREIASSSGIMATSNRLQYASTKDKLNVSSQLADRGILTRNEIREIWNLPPIVGGDVATIRGEYYLMNNNGSVTKHSDDLTGGNNE